MGSSTHHGTPPQLSPAPRRLCCFSSIPPRPCRCPSSSSSSSTCSSSCSSSRSLHLSSCCSSCSACSSSSSSSSTCSSSCKKEEASCRGTCSRSGSGRSSGCPSCSTCRSSGCCSRLHLSTCRSCSCCSSTCCCCSSCSSSGCSSSRGSDGSSCVCIFGVSSFQGFHSFLLMCFINKKQSRACCTIQGLQRHYQSYLFQQHLPAAVLCFPTSFKVQGTRIEI